MGLENLTSGLLAPYVDTSLLERDRGRPKMLPVFDIKADEKKASEAFKSRITALSVFLSTGSESDRAEIVLDNRRNELKMPRTGVKVTISLGYNDNLIQVGSFKVDEIVLSGVPETMTIAAKATDSFTALKAPKTRTWKDKTAKEIIEEISGQAGLTAKVTGTFARVAYNRIHQTSESDLNFMLRLAKDLGAVINPIGNIIAFVERGTNQSVSGRQLNSVTISKQDCVSYQACIKDQYDYQAVVAKYKGDEEGVVSSVMSGVEGMVFEIPKLFKNKSEAEKAADAQMKDLRFSSSQVDLVTIGNPMIKAGHQVELKDFGNDLSGDWHVLEVEHRLDNSGYLSTVKVAKEGVHVFNNYLIIR